MEMNTYYKDMSISSLRVPNIRARSRSDEAIAMAEAIEADGGVYTPPTVRLVGAKAEMVFGYTTVAALYRLGHRRVRCEITASAPAPKAKATAAATATSIAVSGRVTEFETWGLSIDEVCEAENACVVLWMQRAARRIRWSMKELHRIRQSGFPARSTEGVEAAIRAAWEAVERDLPTHLCPWCKGLPMDCTHCDGVRFLPQHIADTAPIDLREDDPCMVMNDGKLVAYSDANRR